jgi:hypothetical protein
MSARDREFSRPALHLPPTPRRKSGRETTITAPNPRFYAKSTRPRVVSIVDKLPL